MGRQKKNHITVPWSNLLPEILELIIFRLSLTDRASCYFVCKSWRSVAKSFPCYLEYDPIRMMVLRPSPDRRIRAGFYSLRKSRFMEIKFPEEFSSWHCCGHTEGWFAMVSDEESSIVVVNMLSNAQVRLPCNIAWKLTSRYKFADQMFSHIKKVILSSSPLEKNCIIAAIGEGSCIALCRPGSKAWNYLDTNCKGIEDIAIYQGKLFALSYDGKLFIYTLGSFPCSTDLSVVLPGPYVLRQQSPTNSIKRYLVESSEGLLIVSGEYGSCNVRTSFFLFKLDMSPLKLDMSSWTPLTSLGDQALFVGLIKSELITANDANKSYVKQNCIYFARKSVNFLLPHAMGLFCMEDGSIISIPMHGDHSLLYEPVWIKSFI